MHKDFKSTTLKILKLYPALTGLLIVITLFSALSNRFLTLSNFINVTRQVSIEAIIAFGMTLVIISGGIDLSVGSSLALSSAILASMLKSGNIFLAVVASLAVGSGIGFINGFIVAKGRIQAFIVTLASMAIARSLTLAYTEGMPITGFPDSFRFIGREDIGGIPVPVIIMSIVMLTLLFILRYTKFGLELYAVGGNEIAASLTGIDVDKYKIQVYVFSGLLAALSGIILTSRLNSAQPTIGQGFELNAIAAVVLGGASLSGGKGSVIGTFLGALLMGFINNGMNILNISPFYQEAVKGLVILAAVLIEREKNS
ncbi:MAG: ribose ABC transporter permease [Candidatus Kryptonium sp.]|nr:ribose ABC transporter permease [Candidatus Kryptonium sp.]